MKYQVNLRKNIEIVTKYLKEDIKNKYNILNKTKSHGIETSVYETLANINLYSKKEQNEIIDKEIKRYRRLLSIENSTFVAYNFFDGVFKEDFFFQTCFTNNDILQELHPVMKIGFKEDVFQHINKLRNDKTIFSENLEKIYFDYARSKTLHILFNFKKELLSKNKKIDLKIKETFVKFNLTQTELIELVKALIVNGSIKGKQKDIIKTFSQFFEIEIKHENKIIQDLKIRNNGSETLFLDRLKTSLNNFIKKENIR